MSSELTFGEWLEDRYLRAGMTQGQFAEAIATAQSTVSNWVNGHNKPRRRQVPVIAAALGVTEEEVLERAQLQRHHRRADDRVHESLGEIDLSDPLISISAANADKLTDEQKRIIGELIKSMAQEGKLDR